MSDSGHVGPAPSERDALRAEVRAELTALGATDSEIDRALDEGSPHLLALNLSLLPRHGRYSQREIAQRAGVDLDMIQRIGRALGLPVVDPEDPIFTSADIEAAIDLRDFVDAEGIDESTMLQVMRILGSSMSKVAESHVAMAVRHLNKIVPAAARDADGGAREDWAEQLALWIPRLIGQRLPQMTRLMEYVYQTHLVATTQREILVEGEDAAIVESLSIGFADLAGFTAISASLTSGDLEKAVERFETLAWDIVGAGGGRVVKLIGDEVMFVAGSEQTAVEIGLELAARLADDPILPDVRVGIAAGEALGRNGDYYGASVNLASRICGAAFPGSVLAGESVRDALVEAEDLVFRPLKPRRLKGIGAVQIFLVRWAREDRPGDGAKPRSGGRDTQRRPRHRHRS